jgi:hypothetical protein
MARRHDAGINPAAAREIGYIKQAPGTGGLLCLVDGIASGYVTETRLLDKEYYMDPERKQRFIKENIVVIVSIFVVGLMLLFAVFIDERRVARNEPDLLLTRDRQRPAP